MRQRFTVFIITTAAIFSASCQSNILQPTTVAPAAMRDVSALRLNFRYEADVPAPPEDAKNAANEEHNRLAQANFDQTRTQELLDKTIISPDKLKILAVYHRPEDAAAEYRLDMYAADGKLLRKITPDSMAVHFPDTIVWSPDSTSLAFVATTRIGGTPAATPPPTPNDSEVSNTNSDANAASANVESNTNTAAPATPTPAAPGAVLTFRTEQIYLCGANGDGVKPLTQNEGLIYFYFVWSPDGSMLASLAATIREWQYLNGQADLKGEVFLPFGRPRLVEKTGRERRLDDGLTQVHPVWSPDSAKIAVGFDKQIRIYDAAGNQPTQAAIPLRNQLLLSSQIFDRDLQQKMEAGNTTSNAAANSQTNQNTAANVVQPQTTLPDEASLVSFNPIINLSWTTDAMLYFQTGYVKTMKKETDSARSYLRWHRLILSPQPVSVK